MRIQTWDFNYPDIDWKNDTCDKNVNHKASKFLECVHKNYLSQLITEPTHYRGTQTPTLVDVVLTNESDFIYDLELHAPFGKSHHSVVCFALNTCHAKTLQNPVTKY